MLQNAATYIFAGVSAMVAVGLATWQVIRLAMWLCTDLPHPTPPLPAPPTAGSDLTNFCCPCADHEPLTELHAAHLSGELVSSAMLPNAVAVVLLLCGTQRAV